ncbi:hypothetical protein Hanom_Chr17g01591331 [Helianthus anomalus]
MMLNTVNPTCGTSGWAYHKSPDHFERIVSIPLNTLYHTPIQYQTSIYAILFYNYIYLTCFFSHNF